MAIYMRMPVRVTWVSLDKSVLSLTTVWATQQLTATITPANAEDTAVTRSSSDTNVATVSDTGLVTCVTPWNCTITVTTHDGWYTAICSVIQAPADALYFEANVVGCTIKIGKTGSPNTTSFEMSTDGVNRSNYTVNSLITLANVGDRVYFRNQSSSNLNNQDYSNYYQFVMSRSISAYWDITYLLNKDKTTTLPAWCFIYLFKDCTSLVLPPSFPSSITTNTQNCDYMFQWCTSLIGVPKLTTSLLRISCFSYMFYKCSNIKLSTSQTWDYTQAYRVPRTWSATEQSDALYRMFYQTWWTRASSPTNWQTYYLHKDNVIVW